MVTTQRALQMASAGDCAWAHAAAHKKSSLENGRIKRPRKQVFQSMGFGLAARIDEQDFDVAAQFPQNLSAGATGRRECIGIRRDGEPAEGACALGNRLEDRYALG